MVLSDPRNSSSSKPAPQMGVELWDVSNSPVQDLSRAPTAWGFRCGRGASPQKPGEGALALIPHSCVRCVRTPHVT